MDYADMELAAANWRYDQLYEGKFHDGTFKSWATERSRSHPYAHRDGVSVYVAASNLRPDDDFLSQESEVPHGYTP